MHTNYIISLPTTIQRREHIKQEFGKQDIPFEFYDALMPSEQLNQLIQKYLPNLSQASLSEGEKACFMSHYILWQKCIDENLPYIFIFEDDIFLGKNANDFLSSGNNWISNLFLDNKNSIIRLETYLMPIKPDETRKSYKKEYKNREIRLLENVHFGTAGYVITNNAAKVLTQLFLTLSPEDIKPLDVLMFDTFLKGSNLDIYQLTPALCIQDTTLNKKTPSFNSEIEHSAYNKKKKENIFDKLIKLITKPKRMKEKRIAKQTIIPFL